MNVLLQNLDGSCGEGWKVIVRVGRRVCLDPSVNQCLDCSSFLLERSHQTYRCRSCFQSIKCMYEGECTCQNDVCVSSTPCNLLSLLFNSYTNFPLGVSASCDCFHDV